MSDSYTLQILHGSDFEAGLQAAGRADRFAAIVDKLEDAEANSITLSAGDNFIPGPFSAASGDPAVRAALQEFYGWLLGNPADLSGLREAAGRVDVAILNGIGVQASAIGNHDLDFGTTTFADAIDMAASGNVASSIGAMFPYLSANLDFSADPALRGMFTAALRDVASFATTAADFASPAAIAAEAADQQIAPWATIQENGQIIGVLAVTTQLEAQLTSIGGVTVKDPAGDGGVDNMDELAAILQPLVDQMTAQGINKIVLLSHLQQYTNELSLAAKLSGVDVIVAGGSHAVFADGTDALRAGDVAQEAYPVTIIGANGNPVAVVSTGGEYSYVGRLVVTFDGNGVIQPSSIDPAVSGAYATTDANVAALWGNNDPYAAGTRGGEVRALTDAVSAVIAAKDGSVFGESKVYLEGRRAEVRTEETNLGSLSADANLWTARQVDADVSVSFKNGGGIRAEIGVVAGQPVAVELPPVANPTVGKPAGGISQLDVENSLRFNNALSIVTLTAENLERVLEHSVAGVAPGATPGGFGQWGGIAFSYDAAEAAQVIGTGGAVTTEGTRIRSAAILNDDGSVRDELVRDGALLGDGSRAIKAVTLSFMADGGDGYPLNFYATGRVDLLNSAALADGSATLAAKGSEQDAMAEYFGAFHSNAYTAYGQRDVGAAQDARVQNLALRDGDVTQLVITGSGTLQGTDANELLTGGAGDDVFLASGGRDTVRGGGGADLLDFGVMGRAGGGLMANAAGKLNGFTWTDAAAGTSTTHFEGIDIVRFADAEVSFSADVAAQVDQLYHLFRDDTDAAGQAYWVDLLQDGTAGLGTLTDSLLAAGGAVPALDNSGFVARLYTTLLDREADVEGQAFWEARIGTAGRAQAVTDFAGSVEATLRLTEHAAQGVVSADYDALVIDRAYDALLGRNIDAGGLEFWSALLDCGQSLAQVTSGILASNEYMARSAAVDNNMFVSVLYQEVLGRQAEDAGLAFWNAELAQGMSRGDVAASFIMSVEGYAALNQLASDGILIA